MHDIYMTITTYSHSKILELPNHEQALALYLFYYRHAKIQKTNQPWTTVPFCMNGLHWGRDKVISARRSLKSIGLIQDIRPGIGEKTYTKLNFITSEQTYHNIFDNDCTENTHSRINNNGKDNVTNNDTTENTTALKTEHKCLKNKKNKCLKNKKNKDKSLLSDAEASPENGLKPVVKKILPKILPKINKATSCPTNSKIDHKDKSEKKIAKGKYQNQYNTLDEKCYDWMIAEGATKHKETSKAYFDTMDKIHALLNTGKRLSSPLNKANNKFDEVLGTWDIDEVVDAFKYHMNYSSKKIKSAGQFILSNGNPNKEPYSPLIIWSLRMIHGDCALNDSAKDLFKILKKKIAKTNIIQNIHDLEKLDVSVLNGAANFMVDVEKEYKFIDGAMVQEKLKGVVMLSDFLIQKLNSDTFKLIFMKSQNFKDEFIITMLKRNAIQKRKKGGINRNAKLAD